ncbi:hypothetical protein JTE90_016527 [Oedothorax gibbosus]|uniref:Uncharacterized protein n=1 Tax=Oedothorax gibbosus TaxID=931172 RepID=A0AAV6UWV4_9ARAC|nr:hypothetical protein JTE90_016527 [Oedothorax gibbosus]
MGSALLVTKRTVRGKSGKSSRKRGSEISPSPEDAGRRYLLLLEDCQKWQLCLWHLYPVKEIIKSKQKSPNHMHRRKLFVSPVPGVMESARA